MKRTDTTIAGVMMLAIGLFSNQTSLAFEQAWRPASIAAAVTDTPGSPRPMRIPHFRPVAQGPRAFVRDHRRTDSRTPPRSLRPNRLHRGGAPVLARKTPHHRFEPQQFSKAVRPEWRTSHRSLVLKAARTTPPLAGRGDRWRPAAGLPTNQREPTDPRGLSPFGRHTTAQRGSRVFTPAYAVNKGGSSGKAWLPAANVMPGTPVRSASWRPSVDLDDRHGYSPARPSVARSTGHRGWRTSAVMPSAYQGSPMPARNARWRPIMLPVAPMRTMQPQFRPSSNRTLDVSMKRPSRPDAKPLDRQADSRPPGWVTTYEAPFGRPRCVWCNGG